MEFIKLTENRYMIKDSNNRVVDEETKLKLEKKELVLKDIAGCECQQETTKKIKKIDKEITNARKNNEPETIEETTTVAE